MRWRAATRVAVGMTTLGTMAVVSMVQRMRFVLTTWWQCRMLIGWVRIMAFSGDSKLLQGIEVFCHLRTSGRVMHGTIGPLDSMFFTKTTWVVEVWRTGFTTRDGTRMIMRKF